MIRVVDRRFDPGAELDAFCVGRFSAGAVASFIGLARGKPDSGTALELEAYAGFTEAAMSDMAVEATRRFGLQDVRIVHRVGAIPAGEAIVLVLTAAAHRRAAFEACDYLMDHLKSRAPLWKKEHGEGEAHWVEPTEADRADLARWAIPPSPLWGGSRRSEAQSGVGKSGPPPGIADGPDFPTPLASRVDPPHKGE
jgi:molybdopterin synthase catalytic subunit